MTVDKFVRSNSVKSSDEDGVSLSFMVNNFGCESEINTLINEFAIFKKTYSFIRINESKHLFTLWAGEKGQLIIAKTEKEKVGILCYRTLKL